jgi:hypothetical protein
MDIDDMKNKIEEEKENKNENKNENENLKKINDKIINIKNNTFIYKKKNNNFKDNINNNLNLNIDLNNNNICNNICDIKDKTKMKLILMINTIIIKILHYKNK